MSDPAEVEPEGISNHLLGMPMLLAQRSIDEEKLIFIQECQLRNKGRMTELGNHHSAAPFKSSHEIHFKS